MIVLWLQIIHAGQNVVSSETEKRFKPLQVFNDVVLGGGHGLSNQKKEDSKKEFETDA